MKKIKNTENIKILKLFFTHRSKCRQSHLQEMPLQTERVTPEYDPLSASTNQVFV